MNKNSNNMGCLGFLLMIPLLPIILPFAIIAGLLSPSKTNKNKSNYTVYVLLKEKDSDIYE